MTPRTSDALDFDRKSTRCSSATKPTRVDTCRGRYDYDDARALGVVSSRRHLTDRHGSLRVSRVAALVVPSPRRRRLRALRRRRRARLGRGGRWGAQIHPRAPSPRRGLRRRAAHPPARGRVAHHHHHTDLSVVFDGCASFHFSEREQYGHPVPPRADRDVGTPRRRGRRGVRRASHGVRPRTSARTRRSSPVACARDGASASSPTPRGKDRRPRLPPRPPRRRLARDHRRRIPRAGRPQPGATRRRRPSDRAPRPDPRRREPETVLDRRARRLDRRRRRRRRRRRGRDARREFAVRDPNDPDDSDDSDDDEESYPYDCDDDESPFGASGNRAAHVDADVDGVFDRRLTALTANAPRRAQTPVGDDSIDDARAEAGETPYVSVVFSHVTLNLYHDAGLPGVAARRPGGRGRKSRRCGTPPRGFARRRRGGEGRARDRGRSARRSSDATSSRDTPRGVSSAQPPPEESSPSFGATARPQNARRGAKTPTRARRRGSSGFARRRSRRDANSSARSSPRRDVSRRRAATRRTTTTTTSGSREISVEREDFGPLPTATGTTRERRTLAERRRRKDASPSRSPTRRGVRRRRSRRRARRPRVDRDARDASPGVGRGGTRRRRTPAADATWRDELARMRGWTDEATLVESGERAPSADELGEARFA